MATITQTNNFYNPQIINRIQGQIGVTPLQVNTPAIYAGTGVFGSISASNISFTGSATMNSITVATTGTLGSLVVSGNSTLQNVSSQNLSSQNAAVSTMVIGYGSPSYNALQVISNTVMTGALRVAGYNALNPSDPIGLYVTDGKGLSVSGDILANSGLRVSGNVSVTGTTTLSTVNATSATVSSATVSSLNATSGTISALSATTATISSTGTVQHLVVNGNTTVQNISSQNLTAEDASVGALVLGYGDANNNSLQVICNTVMTGALTVAGYNINNPTDPIGLYVTSGKGLQVSGDIIGLSDVQVDGDILPLVTNTYSLGSSSMIWKDLYVGTGTIYVGNATITSSGNSIIMDTLDVSNLTVNGSTNVFGSTGPTGPLGPQGSTGPQGIPGLATNTGATGPQGLQGHTGPEGQQGNVGSIGPQGSTGSTGPQGNIGPQGVPGTATNTGATGPQGPAGSSWNISTYILTTQLLNLGGLVLANPSENNIFNPNANFSFQGGTIGNKNLFIGTFSPSITAMQIMVQSYDSRFPLSISQNFGQGTYKEYYVSTTGTLENTEDRKSVV